MRTLNANPVTNIGLGKVSMMNMFSQLHAQNGNRNVQEDFQQGPGWILIAFSTEISVLKLPIYIV